MAMLKIFLVEDEFVVREGIKNNIDWEGHGYEFSGAASDGEVALPMIQKLRPDIVITDIKMPFMDGLALSRLLKEEFPWMEIIILTGYEEFEYAKEGIKIGVAQYLSKPINGADLLQEVDTVAAKIKEKQREREISEKYKKEMEENSLREKSSLFQYLVTGSKSVPELLELAGKIGVDLSALWYDIVLMIIQPINRTRNEYSNAMVEIEEKIKELENEEYLLVFDKNPEGKAFLFKADSEEELEEIQNRYLDGLKKIVEAYENISYFAGVGKAVTRLSELPDSYEKASRAFAHRYLVEKSRVLYSADLERGKTQEENEFDIHNVDLKQIDRNKIRQFLKFGDLDETIYFVEEFFKGLGSSAVQSTMFRQYIAMDAYFCAAEFAEELEFEKDQIEPPDITGGTLQNTENTMQYIIRVIKMALKLREKAANNRYRDITSQVMQYIEKNYGEENLSLNLLASHVNFSPNHLSMVFSQQTGQSFIKYLTDYRMNKAKEMLRCTGKKSSVISAEVGYKDSHYFSYLFKKTQGMTPTQYRSGKKQEGEENERPSEADL